MKWGELSALEQFLLKDRYMDLLIMEAIRSGEVSFELSPVEFVGFIPHKIDKDKVVGQLVGDMKITRRYLDEY